MSACLVLRLYYECVLYKLQSCPKMISVIFNIIMKCIQVWLELSSDNRFHYKMIQEISASVQSHWRTGSIHFICHKVMKNEAQRISARPITQLKGDKTGTGNGGRLFRKCKGKRGERRRWCFLWIPRGSLLPINPSSLPVHSLQINSFSHRVCFLALKSFLSAAFSVLVLDQEFVRTLVFRPFLVIWTKPCTVEV